MCLAVPGQVKDIYESMGTRMGKVSFGGIVKEVCLAYLPEIAVGDYTIVHVGFAISKIDEETAEQTLKDFRELGVLEEELASEEEAFQRAAQRPQSNCPDGSCSLEDDATSTADSANPASSAVPDR